MPNEKRGWAVLARLGEGKHLRDGGFTCHLMNAQGKKFTKATATKAAKWYCRTFMSSGATSYAVDPDGHPVAKFMNTFLHPGWVELSMDYDAPKKLELPNHGEKLGRS